jgi:hypothetical protein
MADPEEPLSLSDTRLLGRRADVQQQYAGRSKGAHKYHYPRLGEDRFPVRGKL